jgi:putative transposase
VSFGVDVAGQEVAAAPGPAIGVDVGVTHLAVGSCGEMVANPRRLSRHARRIRRLQAELGRRQGP